MKHSHEEAALNPARVCHCDCKVAHGEHSLKFCSHCDVTHCVDCKQEWGKCNRTHYPVTYTWPSCVLCGTAGNDIIFTGDNTITSTSDTILTISGSCSHQS